MVKRMRIDHYSSAYGSTSSGRLPAQRSRWSCLGSTHLCLAFALVAVICAVCTLRAEGQCVDYDLGSPPLVGRFSAPYFTQDVVVSGGYAYVAAWNGGLMVIDVNDPFSPQVVGSVATSEAALGVALSGSYAYVADANGALKVIDVSSPEAPQIVASTFGYLHDVTLAGSYVYAAAGNQNFSGLQVIDISDPLDPRPIGSVETPGNYLGVAVSGSHAYIADGPSGLQVIDISSPGDPVIVGNAGGLGFATAVAISGEFAFVAAQASGLQIVNVATPGDPLLVSSVPTAGIAYGIAVNSSIAYVAMGESGVLVVDISNPLNPRVLGSAEVSDPFGARGVFLSDTHVYVACHGLFVFPAQCLMLSPVGPETPALTNRLHEAYPNPFNPQTTIAYDLPKQTAVSLFVYDVSGRMVRVLVDGEITAAGRHEDIWNGRDDTGRRVASGTYSYRLETGEYSETRRMTLVK